MLARNTCKHGCPDEVLVHDFQDKKLGKAIPYGIYDIASNEGWVSVGIDHDTSQYRCAQHSFVVAGNGSSSFSACYTIDDHSR